MNFTGRGSLSVVNLNEERNKIPSCGGQATPPIRQESGVGEIRISSISARSLSPAVGYIAVENRYDHRHRRVRKIAKQYNGTTWETQETHTFVWDGNNIVLEKVAFADGASRTFEYFWGNDLSGTEQGAGGVGGLLAVSVDGAFHVPCYDHNGNIVRYVSETGAVAAQFVYDPYGNVVESFGPLADMFAFGFSTKCRDRETGLVAYQRRFYSPGLGRWLNRDPIEEAGGENLYAFCGNNAIANYDKDGRAYFAYRTLDNPATHRTGIVAASLGVAQKRNWVVAHEQLIFEDGGSPINIGYFDAPIDDKNPRQDEFHFQTQYVPIEGKGAYNDCVMRESVKNVQPRPYKLWTLAGRSTGQYNCQDYADDLRAEYYKLFLDIKIRCKCGLK